MHVQWQDTKTKTKKKTTALIAQAALWHSSRSCICPPSYAYIEFQETFQIFPAPCNVYLPTYNYLQKSSANWKCNSNWKRRASEQRKNVRKGMGISLEWVCIGCVFSKKNGIFYTMFCFSNWILHFADDLQNIQVLQYMAK